MKKEYQRWAVLSPSETMRNGRRDLLIGDHHTKMTALYLTRREAREACKPHNEMLRRRKDLREEPHGWKPRRAIKVKVTVEVIE